MPQWATKAAAMTLMLSFIFMYSYTNQSMCSSSQFLTQVYMRRPCVDQWGVMKPRADRSTTFAVWNTLLFVQDSQWFSITLHLGWLWTLNSLAREVKGPENALRQISHCLYYNDSFFFSLTRSPFHLVLTKFRLSPLRTVSLSVYLRWLLAHQA